MARPQAFNTEEVLHKAMEVFWSKGYESTSLVDLLNATKLSKSSLYATFGGKRDLFLAAFDKYRKNREQEISQALDRGSGREGIEHFFYMIIEGARTSDFSNGCMSINQAVEMAPHDSDVCTRVKQDFQAMEKFLTQAIERGRADGSVKGCKTAHELARILVVAFPGLQVMVRAKCDTERLNEALTLLLSLLD
jgi:TetR/AcrR family transcriptional repressor of nem operon